MTERRHLDYEATLDCVHCGLCLPACPTYQETGRESSSPRGRIYVMRGIAEGRLELDREAVDEMFFCLACRACESACPAGVRYGHLIESMRAEIDARGARSRRVRWATRLMLRAIVGRRRPLRLIAALLRGYQRSGLERLVNRSRVLRIVPALDKAARALPVLPDPFRPPILIPAQGPRRGRVAFFSGCVMPEMLGPVNEATVRVLAYNGFEVEIPPRQFCCGALQLHAGDVAGARRLQKRNRSVFRLDSADAVIVNSAGCGAALKDAGDDMASTVRDVSEFLVDAGLRLPTGRIEARVAYDDPCHLLHGQRIAEQPRRLLASIPGLEVFDLPGSRDCCGAAGIYSLTHPEMSERLLERKIEALRRVRPDVVATGNPGCILQLRRGIEQAGMQIEVVHPVELLDRAYTGPIEAASGNRE